MKVKVQKKKETKEYDLISSWDDVTLDTWMALIDVDKDTASQEALKTIKKLSNIPEELISELGITDVAEIMKHFTKLQKDADFKHKKIIKIEDVEYGFHPKLDDITLGEYADIETFIKNGLEKHLPELCAVLYRPVTEKKNGVYTIEAYDGEITMRAEEMRKMSATQVQSAMVFFWNFVIELLKIMPSFLMERIVKMGKESQMETLQRNGVGLA